MVEHYTSGIVLARKPRGELDVTVHIFTRDLGKISAFVKSAKKITSKLAGHLEPGFFVEARVVEKNQMQIVDALGKPSACDIRLLLPFLMFLDGVIPVGVADEGVWRRVVRTVNSCEFGIAAYEAILEEMGFGGGMGCSSCGHAQIAYFYLPDIMFVCSACSRKLHAFSDDLIDIRES